MLRAALLSPLARLSIVGLGVFVVLFVWLPDRTLPRSLLAATLPKPSPTITPSPPLTLTYRQPYLGFSVQLPASWRGYFQEKIVNQDPVTGEFSAVQLEYLPETGQPQMLLEISRLRVSESLGTSPSSRLLTTVLGAQDGWQYFARVSDLNPYPSVDAQRYQEFSLDIPRVLETFSFDASLELDESS